MHFLEILWRIAEVLSFLVAVLICIFASAVAVVTWLLPKGSSLGGSVPAAMLIGVLAYSGLVMALVYIYSRNRSKNSK